jgi:hypothetical protein
MPRLLILFFFIILFSECKKENPNPQWDIEVLGPVLRAELGIGELIGDSSIETLGDGAQILSFDSTFSEFEIDSIYQFNDTTIQTVYKLPFPSPINPGTSFPIPVNNITLGVSGVQLKEAIIAFGKIKLEIKNTLSTKINFVYVIPKALKNGIPFTVTASVDAAGTSSPNYFTGEYDLSGYYIDLTGTTGNIFNTIYYTVNATTDPSGPVISVTPQDTLLNLKSTLISVQPYFVKGYLGRDETQESTSRNIGIGGLINNGTIELDSVQLNLDVINYIGADAQIYFSYLNSVNNRTGSTVSLSAPSFIQNYLNVNRALIVPGRIDSLMPTTLSIQFDNSNSNIRDLIENLPDKFNYDLKLNLNPQGNISGSNDFVYKDYLINTRLRIKMPLRFALNQLLLSDTVPFTISSATDFDPVGETKLTMYAVNGFPFEMNMQLFLLDSNRVVVDSLFVPDLIAAAPINSSYRATGTTTTIIEIPVDETRKEKLINVKHIGIRIKFNTPDYPQLIQMYSDYKLNLKLVADGIYSIR